jgi:hypothetical protein
MDQKGQTHKENKIVEPLAKKPLLICGYKFVDNNKMDLRGIIYD